MLKLIDLETIKIINKTITGNNHKVLSESLLESVFSAYMYYEKETDQISSIVFGIINNHAFKDGNKRTGLLVFIFLTRLNELKVKSLSEDEIFNIIINIALGNIKNPKEMSKELFR